MVSSFYSKFACTFSKAIMVVISITLTTKQIASKTYFLEVPRRVERLQQNTLVKLRFSDSAQSKSSDRSFSLKLKAITTCFEHDIFHMNLRDNIIDKSLLTKLQVATKTVRIKISTNSPWWSQF